MPKPATPQQQFPQHQDGRQPVHTIRHRSIKAAVWRNDTKSGPMYNVTVVRSYKEGEQWHDSHSFGYDDLMNVAKLMYDAHSFISAARAEDGAASRKAPPRAGRPSPTG